ncbi:hypothetical protein N7456_007313 [Penicillium angulare]|uniref:Uncharacterized protein n=1 Tax=Penicillium angulare TaxID=116970 RepID=A0A9W9FAW7_9EURO|nr:hypothetical protein N7456_007313 [Penicillium angulare]
MTNDNPAKDMSRREGIIRNFLNILIFMKHRMVTNTAHMKIMVDPTPRYALIEREFENMEPDDTAAEAAKPEGIAPGGIEPGGIESEDISD